MTPPLSNRPALTWASYSGMFVFGIDLAILGALLPSLFRGMHLEPTQAGSLFMFLNGGALIVTMLSGPAFDRFGFKILLLIASVLDAISLFGIAHAQTYPMLALCSFLLGLAGGGLNSGTNAFVADLYPEAQAVALSRLGVFFGFGACFIPIFIGSLLSLLTLKAILILTASIALVPGFFFLVLRFPPGKQATTGFTLRQALGVLKSRLVLLLGVLLFFESGNEMNSNAWLAAFLDRKLGLAPATSLYYLSAFWGSVIVGRAISPVLLRRLRETTLVQICATVAVAALSVLVLFPDPLVSLIAAVIAGLCISPIYPCVLGFAAARFPGLSGTVFGALFTIALAGGMLLPWFAGFLVGRQGIQAGLATAAGGFVMVLVLQTVIKRRN
jgi:FHS family glucose/mannose:H+ symporter-like MFS transporter